MDTPKTTPPKTPSLLTGWPEPSFGRQRSVSSGGWPVVTAALEAQRAALRPPTPERAMPELEDEESTPSAAAIGTLSAAPAIANRSATLVAPAPEIEITAVTKARVLYVEDSPLQATYVRSVLESAGYQMQCCADPFLFQSALQEFRPDLVLMDIILPGKTGYELVRGLREEEKFQTLPVLFLTTEAEIEARIEATRAGGDDHLVKPVARDLLLSSVGSRIERSRRLHAMMRRDGLTGLLTAKAFLDAAVDMVDAHDHDTSTHAIWVMVDLDHFKSINDRYGHPAGDRVLIALSNLLRRNLRTQDVVGRCGGEEFALLLEGLEEVEALEVVERLRRSFAELQHAVGDGTTFNATFSAGIAPLNLDHGVEEWRSAADRALYVAKARGRNCVAGPVVPRLGTREIPTQPLSRASRRELPTLPLQRVV